MFNAGTAVAYLTMDTSQYQEGISTAGKLMGQLRDDGLSSGAKLQALGDAAGQLGKTLTTTVTAAVAAVGTASVKTFSTYDDAIRQVQATMGASAGDMKKLSATAKQMGVETRYSATDAANALNYLALAGYNADQACSALPKVLNLAQAGGLDLAYASDLATDAMSALGLKIGDLTKFTDQMARTSQKSNTSVAQLGEAILTVGGTAKTLAGGTVELNTQLGILADNGIKGSEGGTTLRNVILSLSAPTDKAADTMKALGLECYDANGKFRNTSDILKDLDRILSTMDGQRRAEVLNDLFNRNDLKGVEALLAGCRDRYAELSGEIANSAGTTAQMAETMEAGIGGAFRSLSSAAEGAALAVGEALAPTVQQAATFVTELTRKFAALPAETQRSISQIALLAAAMGPVLIVGGKLITTFSAIMAVLSGPAGWIALGIAGCAALGMALANLETPAERAANAIARSAEKIDPREAEAWANAFGKINLNAEVDTSQAEGAIESAWSRVRAALTAGALTDGQIAEVCGKIDQGYQAIYDTLKGFGFSDADAGQLAQDISDVSNQVKSALNGLNLSVDAGTVVKWFLQARGSRLAMVNACKQAGLSKSEVDQIVKVYDDMADSVTGSLPNLVSEIYDHLTDGKRDDPEGLLQRLKTATEAEFRKVDEWLQGEIDALDKDSTSYADDVAALEAQAAAWKGEITALDSEMRALVNGLAQQPASVVEQRLKEFEALEARANALAKQMDQATSKARAVQNQDVQLVRAGVTDDPETVARAFEATWQSQALDRAAIEEQAKADIQAARDAWSKAYEQANKEATAPARQAVRDLADATLEQAVSDIEAAQQAQLQAVDASYEAAIQALFAGLAKRNPEIAAQLQTQWEQLKLMEEIERVVESGDYSGVSDALANKFAEAFGKTPAEALSAGLPVAAWMAELYKTIDAETIDAIEDMDLGSIALAFQGMLEAGLLEGTNIDVSTLSGRLALILGGMDMGEAEQAMADSVGSAYTGAMERASSEAADAAKGLSDAAGAAAGDTGGMSGSGTATGTAYSEALSGTAEQAAAAGKAIADAATGGAGDTGGMSGSGTATGAAYGAALAGKAGTANAAGRKVAISGATGARSGSSGFYSAGSSAGQGYVNGILSRVAAARAAAARLASAAQASVRRTDDTRSPSRKQRELGQYSGEGYALGLMDKRARVQAAAADMVRMSLSPSAARQMSRQSARASASTTGGSEAGNRSLTVEIRVDKLAVRNDRDVEAIARQLGDYIRRKNYL